MKTITNIQVKARYTLATGHASAVQKGNKGTDYIYALQLRHGAKDIYVLRGALPAVLPTETILDCTKKVLVLTNNTGGHTQTWEYAGKKGNWFVGTKTDKSSKKQPWVSILGSLFCFI